MVLLVGATVSCDLGLDLDGDGVKDVLDNCVSESNPGQEDIDSDWVGDVCDNCPEASNPDQEDIDEDGIGDACDECPDDPDKIELGVCGCGIADVDADADGMIDCIDPCCDNYCVPNPWGLVCEEPPFCDPSVDKDCDSVHNDFDNCPDIVNPGQEDLDGDGAGDVCDGCPDDPNKIEPGICGCGIRDVDADGDGTIDCI